ncbi:MAG: hypothetical protein ACRDRL_26815 [Sciscionella sp.]
MLAVIGGLLVIWLAFIVLGAVIHGLFWLLVIGAIAFLGTTAYGAIKNKNKPRIGR